MKQAARLSAIVGMVLVLGACAPSPNLTTSPATSPASTSTLSPGVSASATPGESVTPSSSGSPTPSPSASTSTAPATMQITLYFGNNVLNPQSMDCSKVYAVNRTVPASADVPTATLKELLAGPTAAEATQGYLSWFSPATANALIRVKVIGNTTYVNLTDVRTIIPNASTSCGSAALLAQLGTTAQQAGMTPRALFALDGKPEVFWEWLQMGCDATNDNCNPMPFQG